MKGYPTATILALALVLACGRPSEQASGGATGASAGSSKPLTIKGSDTMVILAQRFAEEYMKKNAGTVVQVNGGGSGTGIAALINGTVDLAQASRPMKDSELASAEKSRGSKVVETAVALDALAVFVHESNKVRQLSIEQLAGIYTGKTKNWKEVGGNDAQIILYGRENSSGTYDYFREHVLKKADFAPAVQTLQGTAAIINAVARDVNGIGYGGIAYATGVRSLGVSEAGSAVEPSEKSVADGTYPLSRKLYFYSLESSPARVKTFTAWALSPDAQALVGPVGYFPLTTIGGGTPDLETVGTAGEATSSVPPATGT